MYDERENVIFCLFGHTTINTRDIILRRQLYEASITANLYVRHKSVSLSNLYYHRHTCLNQCQKLEFYLTIELTEDVLDKKKRK